MQTGLHRDTPYAHKGDFLILDEIAGKCVQIGFEGLESAVDFEPQGSGLSIH